MGVTTQEGRLCLGNGVDVVRRSGRLFALDSGEAELSTVTHPNF